MNFSVVIPLYNKEATVKRAIDSVLNQTVQNFEIVVVNDGSTDNGPSFVENIDDPRIRLIHQQNAGVSAARNKGIDQARFDLIAFLDADDEWLPDFLATISRLIENYPQCAVFATRYYFQHPDGRKSESIIRGLPDDFEGILVDYFAIAAKSNPPICSISVCVRKDALGEIGGFPVGIKSGEDLLTWARLAAKYEAAYSKSINSIFYIEKRHGDLSKLRIPDINDYVGQSLSRLIFTNGNQYSIKKYRSWWAKGRAATYLRLGKKKLAFYEIIKLLRYDMLKWKNWLYLTLLLLNSNQINKLLSPFIKKKF